MTEKFKLNFEIEAELYKEFKIHCIKNNISMTNFLKRAINKAIK